MEQRGLAVESKDAYILGSYSRHLPLRGSTRLRVVEALLLLIVLVPVETSVTKVSISWRYFPFVAHRLCFGMNYLYIYISGSPTPIKWALWNKYTLWKLGWGKRNKLSTLKKSPRLAFRFTEHRFNNQTNLGSPESRGHELAVGTHLDCDLGLLHSCCLRSNSSFCYCYNIKYTKVIKMGKEYNITCDHFWPEWAAGGPLPPPPTTSSFTKKSDRLSPAHAVTNSCNDCILMARVR